MFDFKLSSQNSKLYQNGICKAKQKHKNKTRITGKIRISRDSDMLTSYLPFTLLYYIHIYFKAVWGESKELPDIVCCSPKTSTDYIIIINCKSELKILHHKCLFRLPFCSLRFLNMTLWYLISPYIYNTYNFVLLCAKAGFFTNIHAAQIIARILFLILTFAVLLAESIL